MDGWKWNITLSASVGLLHVYYRSPVASYNETYLSCPSCNVETWPKQRKMEAQPFVLHLIIEMNARSARNLVLPLFALPVIIRVARHSFAFAFWYGHKSASPHRSYFKVWAPIKVHLFIIFSLILDIICVFMFHLPVAHLPVDLPCCDSKVNLRVGLFVFRCWQFSFQMCAIFINTVGIKFTPHN